MRKLIVLLLTLIALAVSLAPIAAAGRPPWAPNNGAPGAGTPTANDNCTGVNHAGSENSGGANYSGPPTGPYNERGAGHACD
jgi:hypothetical protein